MNASNPIRLDALKEEHLEATWRWLSESKELREQIDSLDVPTREGNINYWRARWRETGREDYAIIDSLGKHVGNCGLSNIDLQRNKSELWIYLGEGRGKGVGTQALHLLLDRAFRALKLNRVYLRVVANNERARLFYLRLGFAEEGRWREDTYVSGKLVDSFWFSLLAREYFVKNNFKEIAA